MTVRTGVLTRRQADCLLLAADGKTNDEIAATLYIGVSTVKSTVRGMLTEFDCHNMTQIVALALRKGWIE